MREYLIGTGGWAYFQIPKIQPLVAYSRIFNFVEVNSTFYEMPDVKNAEKWRRLAPHDFEFSVRAHRSITHVHRLRPVHQTFEAFGTMKRICDILRADILHLQTPPSFELTPASFDKFRQLLSSLDLGNLRVALELRKEPHQKLPPALSKIMQENGIIHCVDLSKGEMPAYESDVLYTRLFGKGPYNMYQPTDGELVEIDNKALSSESQKVVMSFHFVKMYKDAVRLKTYKQTGKFPMITKSTGISSFEEALREDAKFPSTKQELIRTQGWKLFDANETQRIPARELLERLPEETYNNIAQVADRLKSLTE